MDENIMNSQGKKASLKTYLLAIGLPILILVIAAVVILGTARLELVLNEGGEVNLEYGQNYSEPGAAASLLFFNVDVDAQGNVSGDQLGSYTITYSAKFFGKTTTVQRTVNVVDTTAPSIVLMHKDNFFTLPGHDYVEEGFVAEDNYDGDITDRVQRIISDGYVHYRVTDSSGNTAEVKREIVYNDITAPELTLLGSSTIYVTKGNQYKEPGYTAIDDAQGDITDNVVVTTDFNKNATGTYTVTYTITDDYGNTAQAERKIVVSASTQSSTSNPVGGVIYLTFDDGPSQHTPRLLEVLAKYNVKATFFVVGNAATGYYDDIVAGGHAIAIHANSHDYSKIYANDDAFFKDLYAIQDKIYQLTGVMTTLMRFPGGSSNAISKNYSVGIMSRLTKAVEAAGFQYFDWNVDSKDAGGAKTADEVFNNVINGVKSKSAAVVLQHDIHGYSVDAVERIIQWGLANGYTFAALTPSSPTAHHPVNN